MMKMNQNKPRINSQRFQKVSRDEYRLKIKINLFPSFANRVQYSSNFTTTNELHQTMRIASKNYFDLYFSLSLDDITISRKEVDVSLLHMDENELRAYIRTLNERELFKDYIDEVQHNMSRIPEERIELILSVLAFQSGRIGAEKTQLIGFSTSKISIYTIIELISKINNKNTRYKIICSMLSNTDFESFQFLLELLHIIELTYGRIAESPHMQENKLVTLEHLYELEKIFLERTKDFLINTGLLDWKEARRASMLWEFIDLDSYTDYINKTLLVPISIPKYISINAIEWSGSHGTRRYEFKSETYKNYIDDKTLIDMIDKARFITEFWELDKRAIETSAAFILWSTNSTGRHEIEISDINKMIDIWKEEYAENVV